MLVRTVSLLSLPSIPSVGPMDVALFLAGVLLPVGLYLVAQRTAGFSVQDAAVVMLGVFALGSVLYAVQQGLIPTSMTIPTVSLTDVLLFVIGGAIPISLYALAGQTRNVSRSDAVLVIGGLLVLVLLVMVYDTGLLSVSLPSIAIPMIDLPTVTFTEQLMLIVALSIPITIFKIGQLTRIIKWVDVTVAMGLMIVPTVIILGLGGYVESATATAAMGILLAHAIGIIVVD